MDKFTTTYIKLMEQLNSSLLAVDAGVHGNDLTMSDFWATNDLRTAAKPVTVKRSGRIKQQSRKKKKTS
jgi:hypothetical protein